MLLYRQLEDPTHNTKQHGGIYYDAQSRKHEGTGY